MRYAIPSLLKQSSIAALCIAIYGCPAGSYDTNQQVSIRDKHTIAYSVNAEKRLRPRLLLQGQVNDFKITDSQQLERGQYSFDIVRTNNTTWEGPNKLEQEINIRDAGIVLLASPVNNSHLEVNVGGGLRFLDGELRLKTATQQESMRVISGTGVSIDTNVKYKFSPALAFSAGATSGHFSLARTELLVDAAFHWTPIKHLQFDFGLFYYGYENNSSTSDYQIQARHISSDNPELVSCSDDLAHSSCPQGDYDSALQVETSGLKAGVTFAF